MVPILRANEPNANGDAFTEECLHQMAEKNPRLEFQNGSISITVTDDEMRAMKRGKPLDMRHYEIGKQCEHCEAGDGKFVINNHENDLIKIKLELCTAATSYHWDGTGENPNRPITLCQFCKDEYYDHWDEQWKEYYSSQGYGHPY